MTGMEDFLTQNGPLALLTAIVLQGLKKWDVIGFLSIPAGERDKGWARFTTPDGRCWLEVCHVPDRF